MAHHRCTRCKQESYPRHKYQGGVYCDGCIRIVRGGFGSFPGFTWLGSIWGKVTGFFGSIFYPGSSPKRLERDRERASYARLKAMEARARDIPLDLQGGTPGKH